MKATALRQWSVFIPALLCCLVVFFFIPLSAYCGQWRVSPIRLDLNKDSRTGVLTITNDEDVKLQLQMKAFEWTQDEHGADKYKETADIIFFPKIIVYEKKEDKILRAGIKVPAVAVEKTYRLFIQEIPEQKKAEPGTQIAVAIRFGVPIFVKPLKEDLRGEIADLKISKGSVSAVIENKGNVHFQIRSIGFRGKNTKGEEIFSKELQGWYLLSGASRAYHAEIPADTCKDIAGMSIEVKTDKSILNGNLDADKAMCSH